MLKKVPPLLGPDLLKVLCETGHKEHIVIADGNCGVTNYGRPFLRMDGVGVPQLLEAILQLYPLDDCDYPVAVCDWDGPRPAMWGDFERIIQDSGEGAKLQRGIQVLPEADFVAEMRQATCLIATGEETLAVNILLRKGIVYR